MHSAPGNAAPTRGTAVLRAEHEQVLRVLAVAERMAERAAHAAALAPADIEALLALLRQFVDGRHHAKEEQHLFPLLEGKGLPRAGGPLGVMLAEHERGRALIGEIARLGGSPEQARRWAEAVRAYVALMRNHIEKENTVLFVMAERLLSAEEQAALAQTYARLNAQAADSDIQRKLDSDLPRLERSYPAHG